MLIGIVVRILVSWINNINAVEIEDINEKLITPMVHRFISEKKIMLQSKYISSKRDYTTWHKK
ncbi:hypothetical protein PGB90_001678 [Kerria lacca]